MTLVEVLIAVGIAVVIGVGIFAIQADTFRFNRQFTASLNSIDRAQRLLRPMTAEIRSATISGLGAFPVAVALPYEFAFYSDLDSDGRVEYVRYYLSGTILYKEVIPQTTALPPVYDPAGSTVRPFIEGVQNELQHTPLFRYFSNEYTGGTAGEITNASTTLELVRMIRISIMLNPGSGGTPYSIGSDVAIRNLKQQ